MQSLFFNGTPHQSAGSSVLVNGDCFEWMDHQAENSIHAVVTDPPYGVKEFDADQLVKRASGNGGIWRIPPTFDGHKRAPLPRFTALNDAERIRLTEFFVRLGHSMFRVLRPGGHVFLAGNSYLSQSVFAAICESGFEFRGEVIRLVRTLRGGDRPKNAEEEFPDIVSMPRGCYEPWGLFRKPLPKGMTVSECLRKYETGGLRRLPSGGPFNDVIQSERTSRAERDIAPHPSIKPQSLMRQLVYAALPTGAGIVMDPFMGSGSTIAACKALSIQGIGIEASKEYYDMAVKAIPKLAKIVVSTSVREHSKPNLLPFFDDQNQ